MRERKCHSVCLTNENPMFEFFNALVLFHRVIGASFPAVNYLRNLLGLELLTVFELLYACFCLWLRTRPLWQLRTFTQSWLKSRDVCLELSVVHQTTLVSRFCAPLRSSGFLLAGQQQNVSLKRQAVGSIWTAYQLRWQKRHWLDSKDGFQGKAFGEENTYHFKAVGFRGCVSVSRILGEEH